MSMMYSIPFTHELANQLGTSLIDDLVDTLHCFITAFLYVVSAILISLKINAGTPIECWLPQTYSEEWGEFSEAYCFLKDTYWYPSDESILDISEDHKERYRLNYYQWASIYLTCGCLMFMYAKFVWKYAQNYTNLSLPYFCEAANKIRDESTEERKTKIQEMAKVMSRRLNIGLLSRAPGKVRLIFVFGFVKVLYLFLAMAQFVFLAVFIGQGHDIFWGWTLFINLINGITWETTGMFPRVTFCDFAIREMAGNNREETIQCLIGLNEFNEKIFLFLWFWVLFLIVVSFFGIALDIYMIRTNIVIRSLLHSVCRRDNELQKFCIEKFAQDFLGLDGKLVIFFVRRQCALVAEELTLELFRGYLKDDKESVPNGLVPCSNKLEVVV